MRGVIRVGDVTDRGCEVQTGCETSTVGGRAVARVGDRCRCASGLGICEIIEGDRNATIEGRNIAFDHHRTSCGGYLISSAKTSGIT